VLLGLTSLLAAAYVTLHVTVTAAVLGFTHPTLLRLLPLPVEIVVAGT
jgi:hypothetical protein